MSTMNSKFGRNHTGKAWEIRNLRKGSPKRVLFLIIAYRHWTSHFKCPVLELEWSEHSVAAPRWKALLLLRHKQSSSRIALGVTGRRCGRAVGGFCARTVTLSACFFHSTTPTIKINRPNLNRRVPSERRNFSEDQSFSRN